MRTVTLRNGIVVPVIGQGTWEMGVDPAARSREITALQLGIDLGMTLIDTAEMYADGGAESVVGEAIAGHRDGVILVSKVLPQNASYRGTLAACEQSLKRLRTDRIDIYLLHWEGVHPLQETVRAFTELLGAGKIRSWGVSNFDVNLMTKTMTLAGGADLTSNQVLYNLTRRGIERRLLPECRRRQVTVMAYSPLEQGRIDLTTACAQVARRHGVTPAQVALAWTIRDPGVVTIPKASTPAHVRDNAAAGGLKLDATDRTTLDRAFPPPSGDVPLETI